MTPKMADLVASPSPNHWAHWVELATWQRLEHDPQVPEVLRNLPMRNPLIWHR